MEVDDIDVSSNLAKLCLVTMKSSPMVIPSRRASRVSVWDSASSSSSSSLTLSSSLSLGKDSISDDVDRRVCDKASSTSSESMPSCSNTSRLRNTTEMDVIHTLVQLLTSEGMIMPSNIWIKNSHAIHIKWRESIQKRDVSEDDYDCSLWIKSDTKSKMYTVKPGDTVTTTLRTRSFDCMMSALSKQLDWVQKCRLGTRSS